MVVTFTILKTLGRLPSQPFFHVSSEIAKVVLKANKANEKKPKKVK